MDIDNIKLKCNLPIEESSYFATEWIDEWVRRRNGDRYTIQPIKLYKKYNLDKFEEEYDNDFEKNSEEYGQPNLFLLRVEIDEREWCPDNIKIFITFLDKKEDIYLNMYKEDKQLLLENNELWIPNVKVKTDGIYYKFVELNFDDGIMNFDIHSLCKYINPELWFQ
jgi:hypothetical protein